MHPGRDARSNILRGENGAERKAGSERLGDQDDVRIRRELLITEKAAGAAESALNLIGDQESAVLCGEIASAIPESFADGIDPAFALDRFQKDAAHGLVELRLEIGQIVETYELRAGNDGREGQPILFRGGDADGAERASMERILQGQETVLLRSRPRSLVGLPSKQARELHRAINGFRPAVREKDAIHPGPRC